jgi:hypothetical protein
MSIKSTLQPARPVINSYTRLQQRILRHALPILAAIPLALTIGLLISTPLQAASQPGNTSQSWSLPAPAGQQLQLTVEGAKVTTTQLKQLTQQLQQGWQLISAPYYWPAARQFADSRQWPAEAALLQRAWQQCEAWWQQQRSYHCRFGQARQRWQALLAATAANTAPATSTQTTTAATTQAAGIALPDRVSSRRQARQWLAQSDGVLPDLQQFASAVLLDDVWQQSRLFWPNARQLQLKFNQWQAVAGSAIRLNVAPEAGSQPLGQILLQDAVLVNGDTATAPRTAAGRYSPVWLLHEAWPVPAGPAVQVVAASFSQGWLQTQALLASPVQQRREQSERYAALWHEQPPSGVSATSAWRASTLWYRLLQNPALQQAATVHLSIELPAQGPHSKRPYLSVWLQADAAQSQADPNLRQPQQLLLLGEQPRWYPELRSWWRAIKPLLPGSAEQQQQQLQQLVDQWAGATRKAGVHQFDWTARQADGQPLAPGHYQLLVEAAREGGGREQLKLQLHWPLAAGQVLQAQGQHELSQLRLQLR